MKVYRELVIKGTEGQLKEFIQRIGNHVSGDWILKVLEDEMKSYLFFTYSGEEAEKARVSIYLGEDLKNGCIRVGNIIPMSKARLEIEEYNEILMMFYKDIVEQCSYKDVEIIGPSSDAFNPRLHFSNSALTKLERFMWTANKSDGAVHPSDQKLWFEFIIQSVEDNMVLDPQLICRFMQEHDYWDDNKDKPEDASYCCVRSESVAMELAEEYEKLSTFLTYLREHEMISRKQ